MKYLFSHCHHLTAVLLYRFKALILPLELDVNEKQTTNSVFSITNTFFLESERLGVLKVKIMNGYLFITNS